MKKIMKFPLNKSIGRRAFLSRGLKGAVALGLAGALGISGSPVWADILDEEPEAGTFILSRFRFVTLTRVETEWDVMPFADENLIATLRSATNIKISNLDFNNRTIGIDEFEKIRKNPFLFMTGEGNFNMTPEEAATLGEYFKRGGFLYADDCVLHGQGDHFYQAFLREIQKVMPGHSMQPVPLDHEIYSCFYNFPRPGPLLPGPEASRYGPVLQKSHGLLPHQRRHSLRLGVAAILWPAKAGRVFEDGREYRRLRLDSLRESLMEYPVNSSPSPQKVSSLARVTLTRRALLARSLKSAAALSLAGIMVQNASPALGQAMPNSILDTTDEFVLSRFRYVTLTHVESEWDAGAACDDNVLAFLRNVTNIKIASRPWRDRVVGIDEFDKIRQSPFLFMTGEGDFKMTPEEAATLGEFFKRGGFLYGDDCVFENTTGRGDFFYKALMREIQKAMPGYTMQPVPPDHEIYRCFFEFPTGRAPFCQGTPNPDMGLFCKNRLVCFLTSGDVHCGWWLENFGPQKHEECLKMAVNIILYALTH